MDLTISHSQLSPCGRTKPDGGALPGIVEKFIFTASTEAKAEGCDAGLVIQRKLGSLSEMVNGYDFAQVVESYWRGHQDGQEALKADAVRWLRGEFTTKTDARNANYEQVLRVLNDILQGTAEGSGFVLGGTPEFLMDTRRGLYSYSALQSRLAENAFAKGGLVDFNHPVLRLAALSQEDFFVLLHKVRHVFASGDESRYTLPEEALQAFMAHCFQRVGEAYFRTPRTTITAFVNLLEILEQNPGTSWQGVLGQLDVARDAGATGDSIVEEGGAGADAVDGAGDDELASFKL